MNTDFSLFFTTDISLGRVVFWFTQIIALYIIIANLDGFQRSHGFCVASIMSMLKLTSSIANAHIFIGQMVDILLAFHPV